VAVGDYGTSAYAAVRGLSSEHVGLEYDGVPLNSLQSGLADICTRDHLGVLRGLPSGDVYPGDAPNADDAYFQCLCHEILLTL
jgi:outer membrane cobalamin receptor